MPSKLVIPFLTGILFLSGCHNDRVKTYPVSGIVILDGKPVRTGTVELESIDYGTAATGKIRDDGTFVLGTYSSSDGATAGKHRVIVIQLIIADGFVKHEKDHGPSVPTRYSRYETSGLTAEIQSRSKNQLVVTLKQ